MSFNSFISELAETNNVLESFVDFKKVSMNVDKVSIHLNQLNYLLGKKNLNAAIATLFKHDKECFSVLDILIAVRKNKKTKVILPSKEVVQLESFFETPEKIIEFIENSGLSELFQNSNVKNLEDYVFGVEVGLDTNARKNRSGKNFEILIGMVFNDRGIEYQEQVVVGNPIVVEALGVDRKLFDFVVNGKDCTYLIEVNFYNGGGSKLNEVARSYTDLASKINKIDGYEFVWITDGEGWKSAKNKLEEAYNSIPKVYNISSIDEFIRILRV